jgi:uncharacterized protein
MTEICNRSFQGDRPACRPGRTEQLVEVLVFLFLIVPSMALSFLAVKQGNMGFAVVAVATILRDLSLVSLILFFLWRNGESVERIGWTRRNLQKEVLLGMLLFVPAFLAATALDQLLVWIGFSSPATPLPSLVPNGSVIEMLLALVLVGVVAVAEETIFRGYLLLRILNLSDRPGVGVVLSALVFSIGHGYEGSAGVITVGALGAVFALVYLWRRSLVAAVVMHFLQDFLAIVLVPVLLVR